MLSPQIGGSLNNTGIYILGVVLNGMSPRAARRCRKNNMMTPNARVSVDKESIQVDVVSPDTIVEVRDYLFALFTDYTKPWTDEAGRSCRRYFAVGRENAPTQQQDVTDLHRFSRDLAKLTGITTKLEVDPSRDGLHVLEINGVDFYFSANGHGYDGWGRFIDDDPPEDGNGRGRC